MDRCKTSVNIRFESNLQLMLVKVALYHRCKTSVNIRFEHEFLV